MRVKLGSVSLSAANAGIWTAEDAGYAKKYGLDAQFENIADSTQGVAAMTSGEVPINCGISGTAVVSAALGGADVVFYAVTVNTFPSSLFVKRAIQSVSELRGKTIVVTRFGTASDTAGRLALRKAGLDPSKDLTLIQSGGLPETLAGMKSGRIDAGVLSPPTTVQARQEGYRELLDVGKLGVQYAFNGVVAKRSFAKESPALLEAVLMAVIEGVHRFRTDAEFGKSVIAKHAKIQDAAVLEESWRVFATTYLSEQPFPTDAGIQTVLDEIAPANAKAQGAVPSSFYDLGPLRKLQDSGFIRTVTG